MQINNKRIGIALGIINVIFAVESLLRNSVVGLALDFWLSMLPGFLIAYWVYHREEPKEDKKDS